MPGIRSGASGDLLGGAGTHNGAAAVSALGAEINKIIGGFNYIQVMFDHDDGISDVDQALQNGDQMRDILGMQPGGGLVQNIQGFSCLAAGKLRCKLHALGLSAGERCGGLPDAKIPKPDIIERLQLLAEFWQLGEEGKTLLHGHIQHIGNAFTLIMAFKRFAVISLSVADIAFHINIWEKMHFDFFHAVALACLAAAALDIKGEAAGLIAAGFCLGREGKEVANIGEKTGIGCRVGARGSADGALIDADDLVERFYTVNPVMISRKGIGAVERMRKGSIKNGIDQGGFSGA